MPSPRCASTACLSHAALLLACAKVPLKFEAHRACIKTAHASAAACGTPSSLIAESIQRSDAVDRHNRSVRKAPSLPPSAEIAAISKAALAFDV